MPENKGNIKITQVTHVLLWTAPEEKPDIVLHTQSEIRQFLRDCARHGWPTWVVGDTAIVFAAGKWGKE